MLVRPGIVAALAALALVAPAPALAEWRSFHPDDGLPSADVHAVTPARDGRMWFGTSLGAARSDGRRWERFLEPLGVNAVLEHRDGSVWFATYGAGVFQLRNGQLQQFTAAGTNGGLTDDFVAAVASDSNGAVWFGTYSGGACRWDGRQWFQIRRPNLPSDRVERILAEANGTLWFATDQGLVRWAAGGAFTRFDVASGHLPANTVQALLVRAGTLFVGTTNGIVRHHSGAWRTLRTGINVLAIAREPDGLLWFGTTTSTLRWDGFQWLEFGRAHGLAGDTVHDIAVDRRGTVWFGTNSGASLFDGGRVGWYASPPPGPTDNWTQAPLPSDLVTTVLPAGDGRMWFGTPAGLARLDSTWTVSRVADGLPSDDVRDVAETAGGVVWVATASGVARVEPTGGFTVFGTAQGLPSADVRDLAPAPDGSLWAATAFGAARFTAGAWRAEPIALPGPDLRAIDFAPDGAMWVAVLGGVARCLAGSCTTFTFTDGLASNDVLRVFLDRDGTAWCGTPAGVSAFDGQQWRTSTRTNSGLADNDVRAIAQDANGALWFGGQRGGGASRLHQGTWRTFRRADGLVSESVRALVVDARGHVWFGTSGGTGVLEPDAAAPFTALVTVPEPLSTSRSQRLVFGAGFGDALGIEYAFTSDGSGTWSPWSASDFWLAEALPDGIHRWGVRARDRFGNVDPIVAATTFEIDATPPAPVLVVPGFNDVLRGEVTVRGTTADARFRRASVEVRPASSASWSLLASLATPGTGAPLAVWDTRTVADGLYEVRLTVEDALGLAASAIAGVLVDNVAPFADRTTPVTIRAASGGEAFTPDGGLRTYFAPLAFDADAVVSVAGADTAGLAAALGGARIITAFDIAFAGGRLRQPGTLELRAPQPAAGWAVWRRAGNAWQRVGGRIADRVLVSPLPDQGRYAIAEGGASGDAAPSLSAVALTPAVFSPRGAFATDRVAIAFELGRGGPVSVRLYNRAGRLVRRVTSSEPMNAGANVVYWDGRDESGSVVLPGPYLVHVGAPGGERVGTVVVTR